VGPEQIAITVGDLPEIQEALLRQAELLQVPLAVRHGGPLASFPVTRLFSRLFACAESDMSLAALQGLLLDRAIPWRQEPLGRALVRLGTECRVLANRKGDAWLEALGRAASTPRLARLPLARLGGYYRRLEQGIRAAAACRSFRQLKEQLAVLAGEFLDLSRWSAEERGVYQFCLDSLEELETEAGQAPPPAWMPAWRLWGEHLKGLRYVPRRPAAGIPVYPYRVAEGIRPRYHLLAGMSQAATVHRLRRYPFLAVHEQQGVDDAEVDLSAQHLRLYCHSGEQVRFHYAHTRRGRAHLPPAWLLIAGHSEASPPAPDPYAAEARGYSADRIVDELLNLTPPNESVLSRDARLRKVLES